MPRRLFVVMEFENKRYLGCVMFDDAPFCNQVNEFLKNHFGEPIKEIGVLDMSSVSYAPLHSYFRLSSPETRLMEPNYPLFIAHAAIFTVPQCQSGVCERHDTALPC